MAGTEYRAKDKIVSKMTREGLTEENIREGSVKEISQRSRGHPAERKKRYAPLRHSNDDNDGDRVENRLEQEPHSEGEGSSVGEKILREKKERKTKAAQKFSEKLRDQESVPEESLEGHKSSIQNKQKKVRLMKEEAKAGKLSFEDEGNSMIRGAGMYIGKKMVGGAAEAASSYVKEEVRKEDEENPAVESVRAGGLAAERTTSVLKETQKRSMRSDVRASRRGYRSDSGRAEEDIEATPGEPNDFISIQKRMQAAKPRPLHGRKRDSPF